MARRMVLVFVSILAITTSSGCGTFANCFAADKAGPEEEQNVGKIYGGLNFEWQAARSLFAENSKERIRPDDLNWVNEVCAACMLAVDMPLTAVGDTLTLPFTIHYTLQCRSLARIQKMKRSTPENDRVAASGPATE